MMNLLIRRPLLASAVSICIGLLGVSCSHSFKGAAKGGLATGHAGAVSNANHKAKDRDANATLTDAADDGDVDRVKALIAAHVNVNATDKWGNTAVMGAADDGNVDCVNALIAANAAVNEMNTGERFSNSSLTDIRGRTALMEAAGTDHADCVRALIAAHADVNAKDSQGSTPLMDAARLGYVNPLKALISAHADLNASDWDHYQWITSSLNIQPDPHIPGGRTALIYAAQCGYPDCVKALIAAGARVDMKDKEGSTALLEAAAGLEAHGGQSGCLQALIAAGAGVNVKDCFGVTPLMYAVEPGGPDDIAALIATHADVNARDSAYRSNDPSESEPGGETALMHAVRTGDADLVKTLIAAGADVNLRDNDGATALLIAKQNDYKHVVKALKSAGAN